MTKETMTTLAHTFPVSALHSGHAHANSFTYVLLDEESNIRGGTRRQGIVEALDQQTYLIDLSVTLVAGRTSATARETTFRPGTQETTLTLGSATFRKRCFTPVDIPEPRLVHFVLESDPDRPVPDDTWVRVVAILPAGASAGVAEAMGHSHVEIRYPFPGHAIIWGGTGATDVAVSGLEDGTARLEASFPWPAEHDRLGISFAYATGPDSGARFRVPLVGGLLASDSPGATIADRHLNRISGHEAATIAAFDRALATTAIHTPDAVVNRGLGWAKVNQQRDQTEYRHGSGFTNSPPNDVVVARDSYFCLIGTNYHSQPWSRRLIELWFDKGLLPNGKVVEYMRASRDPIWLDDYDLNINDDTPLMLIAAHQYYALTGDRGFVLGIWARMLRAADYILAQRKRGGDADGLVFCTSFEKSVRGQASWRNVITDYRISGAVTEINAECLRALRCVAEIAADLGDPNADRVSRAADELAAAIDRHLFVDDSDDPRYLLTIDPDGSRLADRTGDMLIPLLFGVGDARVARNIVERVFDEDFWVEDEDGRGGIRTVSSRESYFRPRGDHTDNYGLLGGLWPNVALWAVKAGADAGRPDLGVRALRATMLLSEPRDPRAANVIPGEFPEYFNSDDLAQRGQLRSTFIPGIMLWVTLEGILGLTPATTGLVVEPSLSSEWGWAAIGDIPYRGGSLSILVLPGERMLITTGRVESTWDQTVVSVALKDRYDLRTESPVFWLVVPDGDGLALLVAAAEPIRGELVEVSSGAVVAKVDTAGGVARIPIGGQPMSEAAD